MMKNLSQSLKWVRIAFVALAATTMWQMPAAAGDYVVVVNEANTFSADAEQMRNQVRRYFLKESKNWPDGSNVVPFARKPGNASYDAMLVGILGMNQSEFDAHWARKKQTTGDTRPRSVGSSNILLRLIKRDAGTIGVIEKADAGKIPAGVKILFEFTS